MNPLIVIGAGGCGREAAWLIEKINSGDEKFYDFLGFVDDNAEKTREGYPVLGNIEWLKRQKPRPYVVCAIANPLTRYKITGDLKRLGFNFATLVDPSVKLSKYVAIGEGSIIFSNCVFTTNIKIGKFVILSLSCTVGHDTVLSDYCSIMPGVTIAGNVNVGTGNYVGIGASIINNINIGNWSLIGGGAVVTSNIPEKTIAVGVPAKPIKRSNRNA